MEKMIYILERIYCITKIPIRYYDKKNNITLFSKGYETVYDPFFCDDALWGLIEKAKSNPIIEFEEGIFLYASYIDSYDCYIMLGPVSQVIIDDEQVHNYAKRHFITHANFYIKHRPLDVLYSAISMVYFFSTGNYISESDLIKTTVLDCKAIEENEHITYILDRTEKEIPAISYESELEIIKFIRDGDINGFNELIKQYDFSLIDQYIGEFAQATFKKYEYLASGLIALATRAAIDGGINIESAHSLGQLYLQKLEKCTSIHDMLKLQISMTKSFIKQVQEINKDRSELSYIEKAKIFIIKNLNQPFTLDDIAFELNINKSYLSRKFSQTVGIGIKEYTQNKRIEAAANMLKFSDESILKIVNYLYFPSQSRFGIVFKEKFGMTPYKYRGKNKTIVLK